MYILPTLFDRSHNVLSRSWRLLWLQIDVSGITGVVQLAAVILKSKTNHSECSEQNPKAEKSQYTVTERKVCSDNVEYFLRLIGYTCGCVGVGICNWILCGNFFDWPLSFHKTIETVSDWWNVLHPLDELLWWLAFDRFQVEHVATQ